MREYRVRGVASSGAPLAMLYNIARGAADEATPRTRYSRTTCPRFFLFFIYYFLEYRARGTPAPPDMYIPSYVTHASSYVAHALVWGAADTLQRTASYIYKTSYIKLQVPNPGIWGPCMHTYIHIHIYMAHYSHFLFLLALSIRYACYLIRSICSSMRTHTYLGQARSLFLRLQLRLSRLLHLALQLTRSLKKKKKRGGKFKNLRESLSPRNFPRLLLFGYTLSLY